MTEDEIFNDEAASYDTHFTSTSVGKAQREQVWKQLDQLLCTHETKVFELNCGTGEDTGYWLKKTSHYFGTDAASEMVAVANQKNPSAQFQRLSFVEINELNGTFDIVFSNFGGVNCISKNEVYILLDTLINRLNNHGKVVLIVMGKKCIWDNLYQLLKGKLKQIGRRNTNKPLQVPIKNHLVSTWFFSPREFKSLHPQFVCKRIKPIGLFVPPSYLSPYFDKHTFQLKCLKKMDQLFSFSIWANYSDHFYIELEKK